MELENTQTNKTRTSVQTNSLAYGDSKNKNKKQIVQCIAIPIYKQPNIQTQFFIIGDAFISLDPQDELKFIESIRIQNSFRPVKRIERSLEKQLMRIKVDQAAQGIKDFRFLVNMMQTMQDQEIYALSKELEKYQIIVDEDVKQQQIVDEQIVRQKQQIFQQLQDKTIFEILSQESQNNPFGIQVYELYNCAHSMVDSRKAEFGFNENYVLMIGTDMETLQQFILREGWFDQTQLFNSNVITQIQFENYLNAFLENKDEMDFGNFELTIMTLDQILLPVTFQPSVYYLFCDNTYSRNLSTQSVDTVVGMLVIYNIEIQVQHIKRLLDIRKQKNTILQNNLILNSLNNTLSQFQYEIQSDYFYNKFYCTQDQPIQKEIQLIDLFPQKVCQYKHI